MLLIPGRRGVQRDAFGRPFTALYRHRNRDDARRCRAARAGQRELPFAAA